MSVALICLAAVAYPLVSSLFILPMFEDQLFELLEKQPGQTGSHLSRSMIVEKDFASGTIVSRNVTHMVEDFEFEKIKVFEGSCKIIFSSSPTDIGTINRHDYFHNGVDMVASLGSKKEYTTI